MRLRSNLKLKTDSFSPSNLAYLYAYVADFHRIPKHERMFQYLRDIEHDELEDFALHHQERVRDVLAATIRQPTLYATASDSILQATKEHGLALNLQVRPYFSASMDVTLPHETIGIKMARLLRLPEPDRTMATLITNPESMGVTVELPTRKQRRENYSALCSAVPKLVSNFDFVNAFLYFRYMVHVEPRCSLKKIPILATSALHYVAREKELDSNKAVFEMLPLVARLEHGTSLSLSTPNFLGNDNYIIDILRRHSKSGRKPRRPHRTFAQVVSSLLSDTNDVDRMAYAILKDPADFFQMSYHELISTVATTARQRTGTPTQSPPQRQ